MAPMVYLSMPILLHCLTSLFRDHFVCFRLDIRFFPLSYLPSWAFI